MNWLLQSSGVSAEKGNHRLLAALEGEAVYLLNRLCLITFQQERGNFSSLSRVENKKKISPGTSTEEISSRNKLCIDSGIRTRAPATTGTPLDCYRKSAGIPSTVIWLCSWVICLSWLCPDCWKVCISFWCEITFFFSQWLLLLALDHGKFESLFLSGLKNK